MEKGQNVFIIAYTVAKWTDEQFRNRNSLICIKYTVNHKLLARFTLAKVGGKQYTKHVLRGKARHRRNE